MAALFNEGSPELMKKRSTGFYNPGGVGGANASVGFNDDSLTNPWDYVFMFEGALLFAGAAARRLSSQASSKAVFPFTVDSSAAGYGTSSEAEYGDSSRAEFWAPLWEQSINLQELDHLVSEGARRWGGARERTAPISRGQLPAWGRSVALDSSEIRVHGAERLGLPCGPSGPGFYTPTDKSVGERAKLADVLFDLDGWLDSLRRNAAGNRAPAGLGTALGQVEDAIIEFCQRGRPRDLQDVLIAVGRAERWVSRSHSQQQRQGSAPHPRPLAGMAESC